MVAELMNDLAKKLLGASPGPEGYTPRTPEQQREIDLRMRIARAKADAAYFKYEQGQIANLQRLLSSSVRYS